MTTSPQPRAGEMTWAADMPAGRWRDGTPFNAAVQYPVREHEARQLVADWGGTARLMTEAEHETYRASLVRQEDDRAAYVKAAINILKGL